MIHQVNASSILRTGIVLPRKHPTDPSLYYVAFGEKTNDVNGRLENGVWCSNGITPYTRFRDANNNPVTYGSFIAIQPYTPVNVLMAGGGSGISTIIGFPPTNTSVPSIENRDNMHIVSQTPGGSLIEMDDTTRSIKLIANKGTSAISIADDLLELSLLKDKESSKEEHTGIRLRKGGFIINLPDSRFQFDETGLSISFDGGGTAVRIDKNGINFEGMDTFKVVANEQVSLKGSKMTLEGVKDASLSANELKVGGKQLTSITGSQINIESIFGTTLKSNALNFWALTKIQENAAMKDSTILGMDVRTAAVIADSAPSYNITTNAFAVASSFIGLDSNIMTNMGMGKAIASPTYFSCKSATTTTHIGFTMVGSQLLLKNPLNASMNKLLADTIAGTSEPAQEKSGIISGVRDKNDKKSFNSVASNKINKNNEVMEKYCVVPRLVERT
jgi:hypothetical protein